MGAANPCFKVNLCRRNQLLGRNGKKNNKRRCERWKRKSQKMNFFFIFFLNRIRWIMLWIVLLFQWQVFLAAVIILFMFAIDDQKIDNQKIKNVLMNKSQINWFQRFTHCNDRDYFLLREEREFVLIWNIFFQLLIYFLIILTARVGIIR